MVLIMVIVIIMIFSPCYSFFFFGCYCIAALVIDYFGSDLGFLFFFFFCIGSRWCHNPD